MSRTRFKYKPDVASLVRAVFMVFFTQKNHHRVKFHFKILKYTELLRREVHLTENVKKMTNSSKLSP